MKKQIAMIAMMASLVTTTAFAEGVKIDGSIKSAETKTILAPYSGVVDNYAVTAGDAVSMGDALFALRTEQIYADFDGTVTAVFAQPGDSAASVEERYGALAYIEQDVLYRAECATTGGDSDNENKMIHVGEKVYIRSTANNERVGEARVIYFNIYGKETRPANRRVDFVSEVTSQTDMRLNENIKVYRSANHANSSCIGTGKLSRIDPQGVTATGYVLAAYVENGQHVSRGDVLFDIVPDVLDGMVGGDGHVYMPEDGVLLSVSAVSGEQAAKDAVLATYCPKDTMRLVCSVDEQDLSELAVGDVMQVTLDAYEDKPLRGTIAKIASASGDDGTSTSFDVTIELEANNLMRIGMSASAEK